MRTVKDNRIVVLAAGLCKTYGIEDVRVQVLKDINFARSRASDKEMSLWLAICAKTI